MVRGALATGQRFRRILLVTAPGCGGRALASARSGIELVLAGHPVPDAGSLAAGRRLLQWLAAADADQRWLFLWSGGASSLLEVPVPGLDLAGLQRLNRWLLASGLDIARMNALRQRFSLVKGGRLAARLRGREARVLMLSDVPGDDPALIGSGPFVPARPERPPVPPPEVVPRLPPAPPPGPASIPLQLEVLAGLAQALEAAAGPLQRLGLRVVRHRERLAGDAAEVGRALAEVLRGDQRPTCHLWGGETTVTLPPQPGRGGRCQHLALAAAQVLDGHPGCCLLAAGSDGRDGNSALAGAWVDGSTAARARAGGWNIDAVLAAADSGTLVEALGLGVHTGPTGTNVADLVLGIRGETDGREATSCPQ